MTDNSPDYLPNLLYSIYGAENSAEHRQANIDPAHDESETLEYCHAQALLPGSNTSPQRSSANIDPALLNPSVYQIEFAQADPARFDYLDTARTDSLILNSTHALHLFEGAPDGNVGFLLPAAQAGAVDTAWDQHANTNAGHISPYAPNALDVSFQERGADTWGLQARNLVPHETIQYWSVHASGPVLFSTAAKYQADGLACDMFACPSLRSPEMHAGGQAVQQSYSPHNGVAGGDFVSTHVHDFPDNLSHAPSMVTSRSRPRPKGARSRGKSTAPSKPVACPICKRKLRDGSSLRHHLETHDPTKAKRYKCDQENCTYASRYPKDIERHQLRHRKPVVHKFVCHEPGCTAKYHRNDFLIRHRRQAHSGSSSVPSIDTRPVSHLGVASSSSNIMDVDMSPFATPQTADSLFNKMLDPRLLPPNIASGSCYFSTAASSCPQ